MKTRNLSLPTVILATSLVISWSSLGVSNIATAESYRTLGATDPIWSPQSSERLVKLPPSYLQKSLDRDLASSPLGEAIKDIQTEILHKGNTLADLQKAIGSSKDEAKLELRYQFLAEKRAYLDLMVRQNGLNRKQANTRINLYNRMLGELADKNAANTPAKKQLLNLQTSARNRLKSSLVKVDLKVFETATVPQSRYAVKYDKNVQAIEKLLDHIKGHEMNRSLTANGTEMTKEEFIRHMATEAEAELALADQDDLILGYMAKLVALDSMALSEEAIDAELADSALPNNSSPAQATSFFIKN
ncbi:MAG: hypothetical protein CMM58_02130 [Rhodospirillaceae bacterium]|nr:hypothetical protein [Rhodospirillaceae bacterium]|tara:strand:- start:1636 stop:2544 length:909 start_codon:yes stop_codon:yes gene_type:complete